MGEIGLKLEKIRKNFGETEVIREVSLQVNAGEHVTILGPSGCGKSTMMNIITGLLEPDGGAVRVNGSIGYMQQKDLLLPWKNILENIILPAVIAGVPKGEAEKKALPYFKTFQIEGYEYKYPGELSGGMRQRAAFLRTFLSSGDILLLDEPFGAVDSITRGNLQQWLSGVSGELGLTILMITHDIEEAIRLSDRICVLSDKPCTVRDEIGVDFCNADRQLRLFDPQFLEIKRRILEDLK